MDFSIGTMARRDWRQVRAIFGEGLATGLAAIATSPPGWQVWNAEHLKLGRRVARDRDGIVLGFAALTPVPDN